MIAIITIQKLPNSWSRVPADGLQQNRRAQRGNRSKKGRSGNLVGLWAGGRFNL